MSQMLLTDAHDETSKVTATNICVNTTLEVRLPLADCHRGWNLSPKILNLNKSSSQLGARWHTKGIRNSRGHRQLEKLWL